jgi:hypothetical protein
MRDTSTGRHRLIRRRGCGGRPRTARSREPRSQRSRAPNARLAVSGNRRDNDVTPRPIPSDIRGDRDRPGRQRRSRARAQSPRNPRRRPRQSLTDRRPESRDRTTAIARSRPAHIGISLLLVVVVNGDRGQERSAVSRVFRIGSTEPERDRTTWLRGRSPSGHRGPEGYLQCEPGCTPSGSSTKRSAWRWSATSPYSRTRGTTYVRGGTGDCLLTNFSDQVRRDCGCRLVMPRPAISRMAMRVDLVASGQSCRLGRWRGCGRGGLGRVGRCRGCGRGGGLRGRRCVAGRAGRV